MNNNSELIDGLLKQASKILEELKNLDDNKKNNSNECNCDCNNDNFCNEKCNIDQNTCFDGECITIPLKEYIELIEIRGKYLELKDINSKKFYENNYNLDKYKATSKDTLTDSPLDLSWLNKNIPIIY